MKHKVVDFDEVDVPISISNPQHTHVLSWVVLVGCESKDKHHKDMWRIEIGLCAQGLLAIMDAIINISEGTHTIN